MRAYMGTLCEYRYTKDLERIFVFLFTMTICCFISVYSSITLKVTTVYVHLYYIPVLIASLWWRRKGIPVVLVLTLLLLLLYGISPGAVGRTDYLRVFIFFCVGILIAVISGRATPATTESFSRILTHTKQLLKKDTAKIVFIGVLVALSCSFTVYFHFIQNRGAVFTHFFYVPIILSALWWRERGLWVAVFLACFLIFGHLYLRNYTDTMNDFFRAAMFIAVPIFITFLGDKISLAEERIHYLNYVISLINRISRLVVDEIDRNRLADGITSVLAAVPGCHTVTATLFERDGLPEKTVVKKNDSRPLVHKIDGDAPLCHENLSLDEGVKITHCDECNACRQNGGSVSLSYLIHHEGIAYGTMAIVSSETADKENKQVPLFKTVCDEFAYALHYLEMEAKRKKAEEQLYYNELRATTILELHHSNGGTDQGCPRIVKSRHGAGQ